MLGVPCLWRLTLELSTLAPEGRRVCSNDVLNGKGGGDLAESLAYFTEPPPRPHRLILPKCFLGVCMNARVIHTPRKHFAIYQIFDALYSPPLHATNQLGMASVSAAAFLGQRVVATKIGAYKNRNE